MKKSKFSMVLVLCLMAMGTSLYAQTNDGKNATDRRDRPTPEQMQQMRAQRLAEDMGLDDKTSADFLKLYAEYTAELQKLMPTPPADGSDGSGKPKELTDDEIDQQTQQRLAADRQRAEVREKYFSRFRKLLTARQTARVLDMGGHRGPGRMGFGNGRRPGGMDFRSNGGPAQPGNETKAPDWNSLKDRRVRGSEHTSM